VNTKKINIIIVEDHEIFRSGLKFVLNQHDKFNIIGEASNGKEFLLFLKNRIPDIVLLDIEMPEMNGIDAATEALKRFPNLKIIVLSSYNDEEYYARMILAGVQGFVLKKAGVNELEGAIQTVFDGSNYFSQELLQKMVFSKKDTSKPNTKLKIKLTQREVEVLQLISAGLSNPEIGEKLFISHMTVSNHRSKLLAKTDTNNTASLIMFSIKHNLISIDV